MKKTISAIFLVLLLAVFSGCSEKRPETLPTDQTQAPTQATIALTEPAKPVIEGVDVFGGAHFDEMLWGYYEAADYDYTGNAASDTAAFREGMAYKKVASKYGEQELSVLPLDIQMGSYSQFLSTFSYEGSYYNAYTEIGEAMFRKAYVQKYGELNEEGFQKLEKLLQMNVAQMTFADPNGNTQYSSFAYEIRDDALVFYQMSVDEKYNITIGDVYARYYFLHDGGKLILDTGGVRRAYLADGYKPADKERLRVAGFARDRSCQYQNLEGFILQERDELQIDVVLTNNARPVDAAVTFDKATGDFSLTWTKSAIPSGELQHSDPRVISGKLIPCTSYGFNGFSGFYLIIDGTCYSYLLSEETYKEQKYTNIENGDKLSDLQREVLATVKLNMLSEMEQAYKDAKIPVSVDYARGQIALQTQYLFEQESVELSQDGQAYLRQFMEIYLSVVLKDTYSTYVSHIVIEGHTDVGSYSKKQSLSMNRADTVAKTCVEQNPDLGKDVQFTGCAYDYPVYKDDGSVDAEKSNRMVFRFLLTTD